MKKLLIALCAVVVLAMVPACGHRDRAHTTSSTKTTKTRTVKSKPAARSSRKKEASTRQIVHSEDVSTTSTPAESVVVD